MIAGLRCVCALVGPRSGPYGLFYPHIAGVGLSFNPYVWSERIDPSAGGDRHKIARLIGQITRLRGPDVTKTSMLMAPGRWGTTSPELGVPAQDAGRPIFRMPDPNVYSGELPN